jgi:hypothetical protein
MLRNITTRNRLVGCWFAAVAVIVGSMVAMGVNVNVSTSAILLSLCRRHRPGLVAQRPTDRR